MLGSQQMFTDCRLCTQHRGQSIILPWEAYVLIELGTIKGINEGKLHFFKYHIQWRETKTNVGCVAVSNLQWSLSSLIYVFVISIWESQHLFQTEADS